MSDREHGLDRRTFLTGAGLLAATGIAGAVVGCAPNADGGGSGDTGEPEAGAAPATGAETGGAPETANASGIGSGNQPYPWSTAPPTVADEDIEETLDCDVLVAGTGISGCCAILAAAESGAKVIYCDKQAAVSSSSGEIFILGRSDRSIQAKWDRVNRYDPNVIIERMMLEGSGFPSQAIWREWAWNHDEVFSWYIQPYQDLGGELTIAPTQADGQALMGDPEAKGWFAPNFLPELPGYDAMKVIAEGGYPDFISSFRCDQLSFNESCVAKAEQDYGAQGFFLSRLECVFKEGDRVAGGYIYNYETGKYKKVNASKGVILCTGDYRSNKDMEAYFLPDVYKNGIQQMGDFSDPDGNPVFYGDHLKIGDWVGAKIQQHHAPMIHHMGNMLGFMGGGDVPSQSMGIAPYLRLNTLGKRFMNENTPGQQTENQLEAQPGMKCYMLWDANWAECVPNFPPTHGGINEVTVPGVDGFDSGIESGWIVRGETIDELLDNLYKEGDPNWVGIDKDTAKASVARYQELCRAGEDDDFNKPSTMLTTFDDANGPFFATYFVPASNLVNLGGLSSDEHSHTFDRETGEVIKGLYVAGNTQGDRFCVQYPIPCGGVASSICMYYGYIAGTGAATGV
jgi:hypothetical protein